jgi:hypothetical protein
LKTLTLCIAHKVIQPTKQKMRNNGLGAEDKRCHADSTPR